MPGGSRSCPGLGDPDVGEALVECSGLSDPGVGPDTTPEERAGDEAVVPFGERAVVAKTTQRMSGGRRIVRMLPGRRRIPAVAGLDPAPRRAADSSVTLAQLMEMTDANVLGNV